MWISAGHGQKEGLGSDHPENETTTVTKSAGCSRQCMGAPLNTLTSGMSLRSRIPTSTVCKENKHGKHAQTERTRRHGQGMYMQVPGMRARRARTHGARKQGIDTRTQRGLSTSGFVNVNCVVGCVCGTCTLHRTNHAQVDCMWITRGMAL